MSEKQKFFEECKAGNVDEVAKSIDEGISVNLVDCINDGKDFVGSLLIFLHLYTFCCVELTKIFNIFMEK